MSAAAIEHPHPHHKRHSSSSAAAAAAADAARRSGSDAGGGGDGGKDDHPNQSHHHRAAHGVGSAPPQENTYLIGPRAHAAAAGSPAAAQALGLVPFSAAAARAALRAAILERVAAAAPGSAYDPPAAAQMAKRLAEDARQRLRALGYGRYKLVVQAVVGERGGSAVRVASRCLWGDGDGWASESYESDALYCVVQVHALYHE